MLGSTLERILALRPGEFYRSAAGFFGCSEAGDIVFLPSFLRMPWHAKRPRIVTAGQILRILRAETIEVFISVFLLLAAIHYFYFDILDFYLTVLSPPLASTVHVLTVLGGIHLIFEINNIPFAWLRGRMVRGLPASESAFETAAFERWRARQRIWKLSLITGEAAAAMRKEAVLLYVFMFLCSAPLLAVIVTLTIMSGIGRNADTAFLTMFGLYAALSVWAFVESLLVLRRRAQADRAQRQSQRSDVEGTDSEPV
jgi:hypothetical protein